MNYLLASTAIGSSSQEAIKQQLELSSKCRVLFISSQTKGLDWKIFTRQAQMDWDWVSDTSWECVGIDNPEHIAGLEGIFDIIILSGGNTFYFMKYARDVLPQILETHLSPQGLVIGISAGGVILTSDIKTAGLSNGDPNTVMLEDLSGFGYISDLIIPHFEESEYLIQEVMDLSEYEDRPIYGLPEFSALLYQGGDPEVFGSVMKFYKGAYQRI